MLPSIQEHPQPSRQSLTSSHASNHTAPSLSCFSPRHFPVSSMDEKRPDSAASELLIPLYHWPTIIQGLQSRRIQIRSLPRLIHAAKQRSSKETLEVTSFAICSAFFRLVFPEHQTHAWTMTSFPRCRSRIEDILLLFLFSRYLFLPCIECSHVNLDRFSPRLTRTPSTF